MKKFILYFSFLLFALCVSAQKRTKVACVGNSITYGYLLPERETQAYPVQLQQMLGDAYLVGNFGKSGATLLNKGHRPYMQQEEYHKAIEFAGDIVVIHLGINDTDPRDWPNFRDEFIRDYLALIDSFRAAKPDCRIIIAKLTPLADRHPRFESGTRDWRGEIQQAIETVAHVANVQLTDFEKPLYPYPFLLHDAIHPDTEGAKILAKTVYSAITGDYGGLRMPMTYTDRMVLQRDRPLPIKGTANAHAKVKVSIAGQKKSATADCNGEWQVTLSPLPVGGPYTLTVTDGKTTLLYKDVLAGEVWLCSGQSNMELMLKAATTAEQEVPTANDAQLRLFDMKGRWLTYAVEWPESVLDSLNHLQYYKDAQWENATPETARNFSAIAYYFGKMLRDSLQVPVGLICNAVGGSPTEAWIDRSTLEYQFPAILRQWTHNDFIQDWVRGRAALNIKKSSYKEQRHPYEPCYLYEAGISPLEGFPIKGVIWYQGESNAHNFTTHEKLFSLLVDSWRRNWNDKRMPFYYVQLSSIDRPSWPWFRDSQRRMMNNIRYTGMAVSSDYGDSLDVHPRNKKPIGERLGRWALNSTYGYKQVVPSGPLFRRAEFRDGAAYLTFDYGKGLHSSDGAPIRTFEVAEIDGLFEPAIAEVEGNYLKVYSPKIKRPHYVRYGWQPFTRANLVNEAELPASTFRAEEPSDFATDIRPVQEDEVPVFITIGQSNADGSAFANAEEDRRLAAWYDNPEANPGLMKIWYRSSYIVNQTDGARWVFDGTTEDVAPGWLHLYYKNDNLNGKTMMNMIHGYGTWSKEAAGRRGMEGEFGMRFQQAFPDTELYILKLGCSGSRIETWASSSDSHNWDYFYEYIYKPAINDLLSKGKKPRLAGIWWMQGEGNGADSKEHYLPLLKSLIEKCRTRLGFPDAHIYIGHIVKPGESQTNPIASVQFGQGVRDAQDAITNPKDGNFIPNVSIVDAKDSAFDNDNLHWGHVGVNKIGEKIATKVISTGKRGEWAVFCPSAFKGLAACQHTSANDSGSTL